MGSRVEQFEQIRRDREVEGLSIRKLAERHGVHRRAVRQALACAVPPPKRRPEGRAAPALGPHHALIDEWLRADRQAPRKQRHTARRIWQRLVAEHGAEVAEVTVRQHVRARRRAIGLAGEAYVPQIHHPGAEAEVDWGEATVIMRSVPTEIGLFYLRACHSGASFVGAFPRMTQQAFLEGHAEAFDHFGGVFGLIRYDNLRSAVKLVLRGRRRVESDRFTAMRSHYRFESQFTLVGLAGAHEKGGVEGEVGRYRRRHLVPVPSVESWAELDALVRAGMRHDLSRRIAGRAETVGEAMSRERALLRPLPAEAHEVSEISSPRVDAKALVSVRQSRYSVPVGLVGLRVQARIQAREVVVSHRGREVARHERSYERLAVVASLDHYLDLLRDKPGALAGLARPRPGARAGRLAVGPRSAVGPDRRPLRPLGGRPPHGRGAAARARGRARANDRRRGRGACRRCPRRAGGGPARASGGPCARTRAHRPARAPRAHRAAGTEPR